MATETINFLFVPGKLSDCKSNKNFGRKNSLLKLPHYLFYLYEHATCLISYTGCMFIQIRQMRLDTCAGLTFEAMFFYGDS